MNQNLVRDTTIVGAASANELTNNSIITLMDLESMVFLGMTFGAWFQICMLASLLLIIIINSRRLVIELSTTIRYWLKGVSSPKDDKDV